ncbi:hypothetical protein, partial [Desulfotignum phosphitoxidans]|uniref:hypothetical protein n=1 Tax=Desulfotignum phosphitoxidans TaxID=190898 RepID=UPI000587EA35
NHKKPSIYHNIYGRIFSVLQDLIAPFNVVFHSPKNVTMFIVKTFFDLREFNKAEIRCEKQ